MNYSIKHSNILDYKSGITGNIEGINITKKCKNLCGNRALTFKKNAFVSLTKAFYN